MEGNIPKTPNNLDSSKLPDPSFQQKVIRTYERDIAEAIEHQQISQVSINMAEVNRQHTQAKIVTASESETKTSGSTVKNILKILLSIILIGGGGLGGYYLYTISPLATKSPVTQQAAIYPAIVTPDIQKTINVQSENSTQILAQIKTEIGSPLGNGQIKELIFYEENSGSNSDSSQPKNVRVTGPDFISKINITPPDVLTRSLTDSWMFGIYNSATTSTPFIILTTNFFQNAFSGMLKWEPTMASDLSSVFSPGQVYLLNQGGFVDKVIGNKNVREFNDQNGNTVFLYGFIDNSTLAIARNEAGFGEIVTRFEKHAYVR